MGRLVIVALLVACEGMRATPPQPPTPATSPGPLTASHASLDAPSGCVTCHVDDTAELDRNKCIGCHEHADLRLQIFAGKGFHASPLVKGLPCEACHLEHRGRGYDLMGWKAMPGGQARFDHALTGWPLDGAHASRACADCHTTKNVQGLQTFAGTARQCDACHATASPHAFARQDMTCSRCHSTSTWRPPVSRMAFDHNSGKDARVPLFRAHADVACVKCHASARFSLGLDNLDRCESCHASPHGAVWATHECQLCHSTAVGKFSDVRMFDHSERTRFDLGGHKVLACAKCHTQALGTSKPSMACDSCHPTASPHKDRFKAFECASCHTNRFAMPSPKWRPLGFDHQKRTKFPLDAMHGDLKCRDCHRGAGPADFERFNYPLECVGCHAHKKVHDGKYNSGQCLHCHRNN